MNTQTGYSAQIKNHPRQGPRDLKAWSEGVRRLPPYGKGGVPPIRIKNHPSEDCADVEAWGEGVRRLPPYGKGDSTSSRIKNHPCE